MQRSLYAIAIALAVLVNGFFAIVNFFPVAPPRDRGPRRYILMQLDDDQIAWFQRNVLDEYNDAHDTNVFVRDTETQKIADEMNGADVLAAVLPTNLATRAAQSSLAVPFDGVASKASLSDDFGAMLPEVLERARLRDRQFFLPRSVATQLVIYRISRVEDAMLHWQVLHADIDAKLREINGHGLPAGYELEHNPSVWDSYDQFVLGYYWARRSYHGRPARGRIAHRTGPSFDARFDLASQIFRAGATQDTFGTRDADAVVDWMQWEALYREHGLYADSMFVPGGLDDEDALAGLSRGRIYLATVDQIEAFSLHGGGHRDAVSRVRNEDDLGFVAVPRFASLALDETGAPARTAERFSFRKEEVWVLPARSADAELAYDVVRWAMSRESHVRECEALGMLPLRRDVAAQRATLFRQPWMQDIFSASTAQWARSQGVPPTVRDLGLDYAIVWDRIVKQRAAPASDRAAIAALLRAPIDREAGAQAISIHAVQTETAPPTPRDSGSNASLEFRVPPLRELVVFDNATGQIFDAGPDGVAVRAPARAAAPSVVVGGRP